MSTDPRIEAAAESLQHWILPGVSAHAAATAALSAADTVDPLRQPGHRVAINGDDWTLQHPAECRPNMLACPLNIAVRECDVTDMADGTYTVVKTDDGDLLLNPEADQ